MADNGDIEQRLAALEQEVATLKQSVVKSPEGGDWIARFSAAFKDDPAWEEIARLGREYRKSQRPETHG